MIWLNIIYVFLDHLLFLILSPSLKDVRENEFYSITWSDVNKSYLKYWLVKVETFSEGDTASLVDNIQDYVVLVKIWGMVEQEVITLNHLQEQKLPSLRVSRFVY